IWRPEHRPDLLTFYEERPFARGDIKRRKFRVTDGFGRFSDQHARGIGRERSIRITAGFAHRLHRLSLPVENGYLRKRWRWGRRSWKGEEDRLAIAAHAGHRPDALAGRKCLRHFEQHPRRAKLKTGVGANVHGHETPVEREIVQFLAIPPPENRARAAVGR